MRMFRQNASGQSLVELALIMPMLMVFVFGIVDFTRALYYKEVITNLAGEGSAAASRELTTYFPTTVAAVMSDADINMTKNGCVVITQVTNPSSGKYTVSGQIISNPCNAGASDPSLIGCYPPPSGCGNATIPTLVQTVLQSTTNPTVAITEVFYNYTPITPIGYFMHSNNLLPTKLYAIAYY
jgi:Flp pilus assembly protein TadG